MQKRYTLAALSVFLLSGCAGINTVGTSDRVTEAAAKDATRYLHEAREPLPPARTGPVQVSEGVWTTGSARRSDHGEPLPRQWERAGAFVLKRATPMRLFEIATEVTNSTHIPVSVAPDVDDANQQGQQAPAGATGAGGAPGTAPGAAPDINAMLGTMGLSPSASQTPFAPGNTAGAQGMMIRPITGTKAAMKVDFEGSLSQFLSQVEAHFNVTWEYSAGEIRLYRDVTRTYTVHALPSSIDLQSTLSADSSSQGGSGSTGGGANTGSNQKVNSSVSIEIWKDVTAAVNGIVGTYGHVTTAVSTGTITVTAPPQIISRVQRYLDGQNARLNKQVAVSVQVLNVDIKNADNYSFDLQGILQRGAQYGFTFGSLGGAISALPGVASGVAANATATPATPANPYGNMASAVKTGSGMSFGVVNPNSALAGTNGVIQALSTAGRVTIRTTASVTTLNGVPAPLQVANTRGYVKDVSISDGTTTGSSTGTTRTQLDTATVTTGFSLSLLPRINPDGDGLLMQFGINISELNGANNGFDNFTTPDGTETVQLPNINSRNFVQQAFVPNGATLVLSGFEQNTHNATKTGVGSPGFFGLGGSQSGQTERNVVVIMMTPVVLTNTAPMITAD